MHKFIRGLIFCFFLVMHTQYLIHRIVLNWNRTSFCTNITTDVFKASKFQGLTLSLLSIADPSVSFKEIKINIIHLLCANVWAWDSHKGSIYILGKDIGAGGSEKGNFPLLYVMKMSLRRGVGGSKKPPNTLT